MDVVVWVSEATWPASIETVRSVVPADARLTLLHVVDDSLGAAAGGAFAGLLGRSGGPQRDPGLQVRQLAERVGRELLDAASLSAGRPARQELRHGRIERTVVATVTELGADLLVLARDGDLRRIGPHSLSPSTRFVVDHAPCSVLLVWPAGAPGSAALPHPPPPPGHERGEGPPPPPGHERGDGPPPPPGHER